MKNPFFVCDRCRYMWFWKEEAVDAAHDAGRAMAYEEDKAVADFYIMRFRDRNRAFQRWRARPCTCNEVMNE